MKNGFVKCYSSRIVLSLMIMILSTVAMAVTTGPPIEGFVTADSSRDLALSVANPSYSVDFTSYTTYSSDIYAIAGYYVKDGGLGSGWAGMQYSDTNGLWSSGPYAYLGRSVDLNTAWVAYKFVTEDFYETDLGGTVTIHIDYTGNPLTQGTDLWAGISYSLTVGTIGVLPHNFATSLSEKITMLDLFGNNGYGTYHGTLSMDIPEGLAEFYVILTDKGNGGYMGYTSLDVDATLRNGTGSGPSMVGSPVDIYMTDDTTGIEIAPDALEFDVDISSWGKFIDSIYAISGYDGAVGLADIQYESGTGPLFYNNINSDQYAMVGRGADGQSGYVTFKFVTKSGYKTASGGSIGADVFFNGVPNTQGDQMWLGIHETFETGGGLQNITNVGDFAITTAKDIFNSSTSGSYEGSTTLVIPEGVREFYVVLADKGDSGRLALTSLSVDAVLTDDPNNCYVNMPGDLDGDCGVDTDDLAMMATSWLDTPGQWAVDGTDWKTVPLTLWGIWGDDLKALTHLWSNQTRNDLAFSGSVLIHPAFGDPNTAVEVYRTEVMDAVSAGNSIGMNNFMMRLRMGVPSGDWTATSWTDTTEWAVALETVNLTATLANDANVGTLLIDVEKYFTGTYLFETAVQSEIDAAYDRGLEVGNAIKAINPDMRIILMPEYFAGVFWGGGSNGIMDSANKFRNGLMKAGLSGGVLVATEGTYGIGDSNANVNEIDVRYNGAYTSYSDPQQAKSAFVDYIDTVALQCRNSTDAENLSYWDNSCGIAAGSWALGTDGGFVGKRSAWFSPELFEAQLQAFLEADVKLIWTYGPNMPYMQLGTNEVTSLGYATGGSGTSYSDIRYYYQYTLHPEIDEYIKVLQKYGNYSSTDIDGDYSVDLEDMAKMASDWGNCENIDCP